MINEYENHQTGWIKIFRSIQNKGWYSDSEYVHLWLHLILEATHKGREYFWNGRTIILNSGQFVTGRNKLGNQTGINSSKVERILKVFENEQQIEQQKSSTSRLISILNYNTYQINEQPFEQQMNNWRTTNEQRVNTKQEFKNLRIKEINTPLVLYFSSDSFKKAWDILIKEPKWKKKTKNALQLSLNKLSKYPEQTAIKMIENTIAGGWQGLFEIKDTFVKTEKIPESVRLGKAKLVEVNGQMLVKPLNWQP